MHKLFTAGIALAGVFGLVPLAAAAAPLAPAPQAAVTATVQHVDWDNDHCGPRCQYWRHRRWEREHAWRREQWRREHYGWNYRHEHWDEAR
ncbi:MAG TPA: hypothetical protein VFN42_06865 [Acetobacteraceae bacterium]|nr:hypothetical protein [Acetobacteraceae bacterium]